MNTTAYDLAEEAIRAATHEVTEGILKEGFKVEYASDLQEEDQDRYWEQTFLSQVSIASAIQRATLEIFKEIKENMKPGVKKDICLRTIMETVSETKRLIDIVNSVS